MVFVFKTIRAVIDVLNAFKRRITWMVENMMFFLRELKRGARYLLREKGLTATIVSTLALGIGANAVMFSLVRGVLLRPLVNRDEASLIYIRQSSAGDNVAFSIPEIQDLRSRVKTLSSFGDFSVVDFSLVGLGEPRQVNAGVVGGSYFRVMGLRPVLGRLLDESDDGEKAAGAVVLTYRFWTTALKGDPTVIGKTIRLDSFIDSRTATIVGVLEPSVPYPQDTQIIANVVTSAHHLSATMVTSRLHRMTELFARLAPGETLENARAELRTVYAGIKREYPEAYQSDYQISAVRLRDELTSAARTILLVLTVTSLLVFVIACSNVANLILSRTVRREGELAVRAAVGASTAALRLTLLSESLLLCVAGAALGVYIANPMLNVFARYMSRFSVRALDLTIDSSMLWVGAGFAVFAALLLAFVPRLPSSGNIQGRGLANVNARATSTANRKLKAFAIVQIAASFVLVASAGASVKTLLSLALAQSGLDTGHVLAFDVPVMHFRRTPTQIVDFCQDAARQVRELPGVQGAAIGNTTPWRDTDPFDLEFAADGHVPEPGQEHPRASMRIISPVFFATLGLPIIAGRDFNDADRNGSEPVAIISESAARRAFANGDAVNHHVMWTDPLLKAVPLLSAQPLRVIGIVPDMDDTHIVPRRTLTIYRPFSQETTVGEVIFSSA